MVKIQSTVLPPQEISLDAWLIDFRVGLMAPKSTEGKDRAIKMMKLWEDNHGRVDFSETIKRLRHD